MLLMVAIHWWEMHKIWEMRKTIISVNIKQIALEKKPHLFTVFSALCLQCHYSNGTSVNKWGISTENIRQVAPSGVIVKVSHFLPSNDVTWKQKRRSSLSTAMTEQLSRSVTSPPATSPRPCCIRLPPCVKKYWRSQEDETRPVLLRCTKKSSKTHRWKPKAV